MVSMKQTDLFLNKNKIKLFHYTLLYNDDFFCIQPSLIKYCLGGMLFVLKGAQW